MVGKDCGLYQIFNLQFSCFCGNMINAAAFEMNQKWCGIGFMQRKQTIKLIYHSMVGLFVHTENKIFHLLTGGVSEQMGGVDGQGVDPKENSTRLGELSSFFRSFIFFSMTRMWDMKNGAGQLVGFGGDEIPYLLSYEVLYPLSKKQDFCYLMIGNILQKNTASRWRSFPSFTVVQEVFWGWNFIAKAPKEGFPCNGSGGKI